jgi:hypothetical protein
LALASLFEAGIASLLATIKSLFPIPIAAFSHGFGNVFKSLFPTPVAVLNLAPGVFKSLTILILFSCHCFMSFVEFFISFD